MQVSTLHTMWREGLASFEKVGMWKEAIVKKEADEKHMRHTPKNLVRTTALIPDCFVQLPPNFEYKGSFAYLAYAEKWLQSMVIAIIS